MTLENELPPAECSWSEDPTVLPNDARPAPHSPGESTGSHRSGGPGWVVAATFALVWGTMLIVPPLYLVAHRDAWLASLGAPVVQEDWEDFRRAMRAESGAEGPVGPVQRKVPKSPEPPLRVWLRDYLPLAITAWLVLGGTLGGFFGMMIVGASRGRVTKVAQLPGRD